MFIVFSSKTCLSTFILFDILYKFRFLISLVCAECNGRSPHFLVLFPMFYRLLDSILVLCRLQKPHNTKIRKKSMAVKRRRRENRLPVCFFYCSKPNDVGSSRGSVFLCPYSHHDTAKSRRGYTQNLMRNKQRRNPHHEIHPRLQRESCLQQFRFLLCLYHHTFG